MRQVEPQDATFLYIEGRNRHSHGTLAWIYDPAGGPRGGLRHADLLRHVEQRLHVASLLHQKLARVPLDLDYPYWIEDESFDIAHHVREAPLAEPGDWASLFRTLAEVHSAPMALDRPLWEIHLVRGLDVPELPKGAFALLLKLHHVALDGAAAMALLQGLHDTESQQAGAARVAADETDAPLPARALVRAGTVGDAVVAARVGPARPPAGAAMLRATAVNNLQYSLRGAQALARMAGRLPELLSSVRLRSLFSGAAAPETLFNQPVSPERSIGVLFVELDEIKALRRLVSGATVNDVLLAICGGALRRYLAARDALPGESMITVCPMNVRSAEESGATAGNRISVLSTPLHTDVADPVERLAAIHRTTRRAKHTMDAIGRREVLELGNSLPSALQALAIRAIDALPDSVKLPRMFNLSISNLPGPAEPLYLGGARLHRIAGGMPVGDGYGLFVTICTCNGQLAFTVTSARNILPDPQELMDEFRASYEEYREAARVRA